MNGPTLLGVDWVLGDEKRLIQVTLGGLYRRIPLGNETHYGAMPPYRDYLTDEQAADVLTYIRQAWGNAAPPISKSRIAELRSESANRMLPWTAEELGLKSELRLGTNGEALRPYDPFAGAGFDLYQTICQNCHQPDGKGLPVDDHGFPPLVDTDWVTGSPARLVRIVLGGLQGKIQVNGRPYTGNSEIMPAWGPTLTDEQVAQVLTFVRQGWTNHAPPVSPELVKSIRQEVDKRQGAMWTAEQLNALDRNLEKK